MNTLKPGEFWIAEWIYIKRRTVVELVDWNGKVEALAPGEDDVWPLSNLILISKVNVEVTQ